MGKRIKIRLGNERIGSNVRSIIKGFTKPFIKTGQIPKFNNKYEAFGYFVNKTISTFINIIKK